VSWRTWLNVRSRSPPLLEYGKDLRQTVQELRSLSIELLLSSHTQIQQKCDTIGPLFCPFSPLTPRTNGGLSPIVSAKAYHMAKRRVGYSTRRHMLGPCAQRRCYPTGRRTYRPSVTSWLSIKLLSLSLSVVTTYQWTPQD
jgi:hypothetical protein